MEGHSPTVTGRLKPGDMTLEPLLLAPPQVASLPTTSCNARGGSLQQKLMLQEANPSATMMTLVKQPLSAAKKQKYTSTNFREANCRSAGPAIFKSSTLTHRSGSIKLQQKEFDSQSDNDEQLSLQKGEVMQDSPLAHLKKHRQPIIGLFTIYGIPLDGPVSSPSILTSVSPESFSEEEPKNRSIETLKKKFPYLGVIDAVAGHPDFTVVREEEQLEERYDEGSLQETPSISTKITGEHVFVASISYPKLFVREGHLYRVQETMQMSAAQSTPIYNILFSFLRFIHSTVVVPKNKRVAISFYRGQEDDCLEKDGSIEQSLLQRIEFLTTVVFKHLYFKYNVIDNICFSFSPSDRALKDRDDAQTTDKAEIFFSNPYFHELNTKIDNFRFASCIEKIGGVDKLLLLVKAILLERNIIFVAASTADIPYVILGLLSLIEPLRWSYPLIPELPQDMIGALDSPIPFIIGISASLWDARCRAEMTESFKEQNFIIFDLDTKETKCLPIRLSQVAYEPEIENNVQLPKEFSDEIRDAYSKLEAKKLYLQDDQYSTRPKFGTISNFSEASDKGATQPMEKQSKDEKYWLMFQLKLKQAFMFSVLRLIGRFPSFFKDNEQIETKAKRRGGMANLSCDDIFDRTKFSSALYESTHLKEDAKEFIEVLIRRQAFSMLVEEVFKIKNNIIPRHPRLPAHSFVEFADYLARHSAAADTPSSPGRIGISSLRELKRKHNSQIDKLLYYSKKVVSFNLQIVMEEYIRQIVIKNKLIEDIEVANDAELREACEKFYFEQIASKENDEQGVDPHLLTPMKGIDYSKLQRNHSRLQEKNYIKSIRKNLLQSQDSRYKGIAAYSSGTSEGGQSELRFGGRSNLHLQSIQSSELQKKLFSRQGSLPMDWSVHAAQIEGHDHLGPLQGVKAFNPKTQRKDGASTSLQIGKVSHNRTGRVPDGLRYNALNFKTLDSQQNPEGQDGPTDFLKQVLSPEATLQSRGVAAGRSPNSIKNLTRYLNSYMTSTPGLSSTQTTINAQTQSRAKNNQTQVPPLLSSHEDLPLSDPKLQAVRQHFMNAGRAGEPPATTKSVFDRRKATLQIAQSHRPLISGDNNNYLKPPANPASVFSSAGKPKQRTERLKVGYSSTNQTMLSSFQSSYVQQEKQEQPYKARTSKGKGKKALRPSKTAVISINLKDKPTEEEENLAYSTSLRKPDKPEEADEFHQMKWEKLEIQNQYYKLGDSVLEGPSSLSISKEPSKEAKGEVNEQKATEEDLDVGEEDDGKSSKSRHSFYSNQLVIAASYQGMQEQRKKISELSQERTDPPTAPGGTPLNITASRAKSKSRNDTDVQAIPKPFPKPMDNLQMSMQQSSLFEQCLQGSEDSFIQVSSRIQSELTGSRPSADKPPTLSSPSKKGFLFQTGQSSQKHLSGATSHRRARGLVTPGANDDMTYQTMQSEQFKEHIEVGRVLAGSNDKRQPSTRYEITHQRENTFLGISATEQKHGDRENLPDLPDLKTCPQNSRVLQVGAPGEYLQNEEPVEKARDFHLPELPLAHKYNTAAGGGDTFDFHPEHYQDLQSEEENIADTSRDGLLSHEPKVINGDSTLLFSKSQVKLSHHLSLIDAEADSPTKVGGIVRKEFLKEEDPLIPPQRLEKKKMSSPIMHKSPPANYSGSSVREKGKSKMISVPLAPDSLKSPQPSKIRSDIKTMSNDELFQKLKMATSLKTTGEPGQFNLGNEPLGQEEGFEKAFEAINKTMKENANLFIAPPQPQVDKSISDFAESSLIPSELGAMLVNSTTAHVIHQLSKMTEESETNTSTGLPPCAPRPSCEATLQKDEIRKEVPPRILKEKSPIKQDVPSMRMKKFSQKKVDNQVMSPNSIVSGATTIKKATNLNFGGSRFRYGSPTLTKNFSERLATKPSAHVRTARKTSQVKGSPVNNFGSVASGKEGIGLRVKKSPNKESMRKSPTQGAMTVKKIFKSPSSQVKMRSPSGKDLGSQKPALGKPKVMSGKALHKSNTGRTQFQSGRPQLQQVSKLQDGSPHGESLIPSEQSTVLSQKPPHQGGQKPPTGEQQKQLKRVSTAVNKNMRHKYLGLANKANPLLATDLPSGSGLMSKLNNRESGMPCLGFQSQALQLRHKPKQESHDKKQEEDISFSHSQKSLLPLATEQQHSQMIPIVQSTTKKARLQSDYIDDDSRMLALSSAVQGRENQTADPKSKSDVNPAASGRRKAPHTGRSDQYSPRRYETFN